ncbi:MAG TPA: phosphotransferase [Candidatus Binatia bacterium]|jgi:Ser/Thr protein kinase RdoA (MazF antagonist)|nr:phosphotransferase [Candidatus Binatia bacterium]
MIQDFYQLTPAQQAERFAELARQAVTRWGIARDAELVLLKHRENAVFGVQEPDGGQKIIMRIHRFNYHSDPALRSELEWMQVLHRDGIPTPTVLPSRQNNLFEVVACDAVPEPRQCDVLSFIEGKPLGSIEGAGREDTQELLSNYRLVGELTARLHNHASTWDVPAAFSRHAWDEEGLVGEQPVWGRFWELPAFTRAQRQVLLSAKAKVREKLGSFGKSRGRYGIIHADLLPENLLIGRNGLCLIDFDDAGFGWYMFDIATSLFFHVGEAYFAALKQAYLAGYESVRPLPRAHLDMLEVFLLARGFTYLGWCHTRSETETAQQLTPLLVASVTGMASAWL